MVDAYAATGMKKGIATVCIGGKKKGTMTFYITYNVCMDAERLGVTY